MNDALSFEEVSQAYEQAVRRERLLWAQVQGAHPGTKRFDLRKWDDWQASAAAVKELARELKSCTTPALSTAERRQEALLDRSAAGRKIAEAEALVRDAESRAASPSVVETELYGARLQVNQFRSALLEAQAHRARIERTIRDLDACRLR